MSKDQLYEKIYELLQSGKIKEACRTVAEYELNSPNPRGLLDNVQDYWQNYPHPRDLQVLETIFSEHPEILSFLNKQDLQVARNIAAANFLLGTDRFYRWVKPNFNYQVNMNPDAIPRMLLFYAITNRNIKEYKAMGIKYIQLNACHDGCEACKVRHDEIFPIDNAPVVPHADCTHKMGCRCDYLPVFEDEINAHKENIESSAFQTSEPVLSGLWIKLKKLVKK